MGSLIPQEEGGENSYLVERSKRVEEKKGALLLTPKGGKEG